MSPTQNRQIARRDSNAKPYAKLAPTEDSTQHATQRPNETSIPGFPTYAQYKHIESTYLGTLSQRKREKALITQAMFDKIWDTLEDPDRRIDTPQFRFWVRKMFRLSTPHDPTLARPASPGADDIILIHDDRPVAIQEQLYELICYCHGIANHGGRDRTRQVVREHYSWVPKELVAQFVKVCPTCTIRRCGNPDVVSAAKSELPSLAQCDSLMQSSGEPPSESVDAVHFSYPTRQDQPIVPHIWPPSHGPLGCPNDVSSSAPLMKYMFVSESGKPARESALAYDSVNLPSTPMHSPVIPRGLQSHPMSREVSLYKGLPNGWQYRSDYPAAFEAHMKDRGHAPNPARTCHLQRDRRPRVPSIAPLRGADFALLRSSSVVERSREMTLTLPPMLKSLSEGPSDTLPPSLQNLLVFPPEPELETQAPYVPQIDPILFGLEMAAHLNNGAQQKVREFGSDAAPSPDSLAKVRVSSPTPTKLPPRRPVPPTLDLSAMAPPSSVSFNDYRSGFASPFSVSGGATPSTGSCYSQLSPFSEVSPSSLGESSPSSSTLPSPSEEKTNVAKELAQTTDGLQL